MPVCSVTLSANAGVSLRLAESTVWIDAIHRHKAPHFSTVSADLWKKMQDNEAFPGPDVIAFTHKHPDHYSRTLIGQAMERYPKAKIASPVEDFPEQLYLTGSEVRTSLGGLEFYFFRLPHAGDIYRDVPHYGVLISKGDFRVLVAGDCEVAAEELASCLRGVPVELALLNFPWITLRRGREFLKECIRPKRLVLYHLPFAADDDAEFREAAKKCKDKVSFVQDVRLLMNPLQSELFTW